MRLPVLFVASSLALGCTGYTMEIAPPLDGARAPRTVPWFRCFDRANVPDLCTDGFSAMTHDVRRDAWDLKDPTSEGARLLALGLESPPARYDAGVLRLHRGDFWGAAIDFSAALALVPLDSLPTPEEPEIDRAARELLPVALAAAQKAPRSGWAWLHVEGAPAWTGALPMRCEGSGRLTIERASLSGAALLALDGGCDAELVDVSLTSREPLVIGRPIAPIVMARGRAHLAATGGDWSGPLVLGGTSRAELTGVSVTGTEPVLTIEDAADVRFDSTIAPGRRSRLPRNPPLPPQGGKLVVRGHGKLTLAGTRFGGIVVECHDEGTIVVDGVTMDAADDTPIRGSDACTIEVRGATSLASKRGAPIAASGHARVVLTSGTLRGKPSGVVVRESATIENRGASVQDEKGTPVAR